MFAPATFNAVTKLALARDCGFAAATVTARNIGTKRRVLVVPSMDDGLRAHPLCDTHMAVLRSWGVNLHEISADVEDEQWWKLVVAQFLKLRDGQSLIFQPTLK